MGPAHTPPVSLGRAKYAKSVVTHEFGHAAGLVDLYKYVNEDGTDIYEDFLMGSFASIGVPGNDIRYIQQTYRNHHGGIAHTN